MADPTAWPMERKQAAMEEICRRIAKGESLRHVCSEDHLPPKKTVLAWIKIYPDFSECYKEAGEEQADWFAEQVLEVAKSVKGGTKEDILQARLEMDALKWRAGKQHPRVWGDRTQVEVSGTVDVRRVSNEELLAKLAALQPVVQKYLTEET